MHMAAHGSRSTCCWSGQVREEGGVADVAHNSGLMMNWSASLRRAYSAPHAINRQLKFENTMDLLAILVTYVCMPTSHSAAQRLNIPLVAGASAPPRIRIRHQTWCRSIHVHACMHARRAGCAVAACPPEGTRAACPRRAARRTARTASYPSRRLAQRSDRPAGRQGLAQQTWK